MAGSPRRRIFKKEDLDAKFGPEHTSATNELIQGGGYPDTGSGRYTFAMGYKAWYEFNVAQRGHLNYLENIQ